MTTASSIDWSSRMASRARRMKPSALRQLLKATARPGMISFAGGLPAAELFPVDRVEAATRALLRRLGGNALQYGETEGVAELREWIARRHSTGGVRLRAENVLITSGAQQALDLAGRVLLDEGDRVVVENPTYMAALLAWAPCGARFVPVGSDDHGMRLDTLNALLETPPKMIYLIPDFQNPTGVCLDGSRRQSLIDSLRERDVLIFEDCPYSQLRYGGEPIASLLELDAPPDEGGHVLQAGTFSKTLMPGLRVGWAIGPRVVIERMSRAKQAMDLHTSTFNQHLALELLHGGYLEEFLPKLRRVYCERRDAMVDALEKHFPSDACWTKPDGGMFIFVTLAENIAAGNLLPRALDRNVAFVPGEEFHLDGSGQNTLRLNFTRSDPSAISEGIRRLADICR